MPQKLSWSDRIGAGVFYHLPAIVSFILFFAAWEILVQCREKPPFFIPSPAAILDSIHRFAFWYLLFFLH